MNVIPLKKNVLVAERKRENTTASGIVIESAAGLGESKTGKVMAVGPEVTEVKVGDVILLMWNKASMVTVDGAQRVMIKEEDIVAVLEDEE
jgi:chaperonin GroES